MPTITAINSVIIQQNIDQITTINTVDGAIGKAVLIGLPGGEQVVNFGPQRQIDRTLFPLGTTGKITLTCTVGSITYTKTGSSFPLTETQLQTVNALQKVVSVPTRAFIIGDSISSVGPYGTGVTSMYCSQLAAKFTQLTWVQAGMPGEGINGYYTNSFCGPGAILSDKDIVLGLHGFNDMRTVGPASTKIDDIQLAYEGLYSWAAVPETAKVRSITAPGVQNPDVTYVGGWTTNFAGFAGGNFSSYTGSNAASQTYTVNGDTVYVWYMKTDASSGKFTITIDGVIYGTVSSNLAYVALAGTNAAYVPCVFRVPGLTNGVHTVVVTSIAAATFVLIGAAGFVRNTVLGPTVLAGNCLRMPAIGYAGGAGYQANDPALVSGTWAATTEPQWMFGDGGVESYNIRHKRAVDSLREDGLSVKMIDVSTQYLPTIQASADNIHPSQESQNAIFRIFTREINLLLKTS